jgi:3'(2'), 5'-bisphosphate nucleotidase
MQLPVFQNIDTAAVYKIAVDAGKAILSVYETSFVVENKEDNSPLTEADKQSHRVIEAGLLGLYPEIPVLSEEAASVDFEVRKKWKRFWLVDPLDGTKEFVKRNGDFTVNIALIENGRPVFGVVYVPISAIGFVGVVGSGAFKIASGIVQKIAVAKNTSANLVRVVASRSHLSDATLDFINKLKDEGKHVVLSSRGSSLKLCMVAEGAADVYPRFAPTMEWDTAAAQAVVEAAGKSVLSFPTMQPLLYNKASLRNPWFIVQ